MNRFGQAVRRRLGLEPVVRSPTPAIPLAEDGALHEQARTLMRAAKAPSTLRAYRADWRHFTAWCESRETPSLPAAAETVALYLAALARTHRPATIARRLTSIAKAHAAAGHPNPATTRHLVVAETMEGIRRTLGVVQRGKAPLLTAELLRVLSYLPAKSPAGLRDRAVLLLGFSGGLRRSELAALRLEDVERRPEGAVLTLRRSKTDPRGEGRQVAIPHGRYPDSCPLVALYGWLVAAEIQAGPLFREVDRHGRTGERALHPDSVGGIVKRAVKRAGLDPKDFAGHSLRSGFATQAARNGASAFEIMRQTGHRSANMVNRYIRESQLFDRNAAGGLGL